MTAPLAAADPIDAHAFRTLKLRTIFEHHKWDPQVGDVDVLCRFPLLIQPHTWQSLADAAERMAAEAVASERELLCKPALLGELGLPRAVARLLRRVKHDADAPNHLRAMRLDFHWTAEGWRVSECNADVPGGWNEASGFSALVAEHYRGAEPAGDPTDALVRAMRRRVGHRGRVALLHATAYVDDRQVMQFIADRAVDAGLDPLLLSPAQLSWSGGRPECDGRLDLLLRFFPAEWLVNLRPRGAWTPYFGALDVPTCNPATSLLIQSKRWPLLWDRLDTPLPTWRQYLPTTLDPRHTDRRDTQRWVLKPALGRIGEGVLLDGFVPAKLAQRIRRDARFHPRRWVAQRRFESVPIPTPDGPMHACVGVYVVDGRAAGAYARLAPKALIDMHAQDAALLVPQPAAAHTGPANVTQGAACA